MKRKFLRSDFTSDQRAAINDIAKEYMQEQCAEITSRAANEVLIAMYQAGLSPRTINRVVNILPTVVEMLDGIRNPKGGLKNAGNPENVHDADIWVHEYLTGKGIEEVKAVP